MSSPRAKALSFELEHNSTVSWHSCSPAYYRARNLATLDTCAGVPPQVTGGSIQLEGPGVQAPYMNLNMNMSNTYVRFPVRLSLS